MADREQTISRLNEIAEYFHECRMNVSFASKAEHFFELQSAAYDAAEMLKEQEPVPPRKDKRYIEYSDTDINFPDTYDCGNCGEELPDNAKYCPACGRAVKWDG